MSVVCAVVFVWWLVTAVFPVLIVETKYQIKKFMSEALHIDSLAQLFIPDFSGLNLAKRTPYSDYGIVIPAIFLDEPVVFNVDPNDTTAYTAALKLGIAHASGTSFPDTPGLGYYFAHSSSPQLASQYNAVFYLLGKLKPNDDIYIWHEGQDYNYKVTQSIVTDPSDISFLNAAYAKETIVLQPCWPPGTTQNRMLVFAERVE
jgi:LPXTG-site transpeptidase (sortase) family protein